MNVTFKLNNEDLNDAFVAHAEKYGCVGVKGHRSVGGFRASIYNAMSQEGVDVLCEAIKTFESEHA